MSSEPSEIAVTLICTSEHEATLSGLLRRIEAAGFPVRVVFDGQRELDRIVAVLDEIGERGLFVLCEIGQTDELGFRRIESTLARHGTDLHRLIRLDLLGRSPTVLSTRIARECEELAKLESLASVTSEVRPPPSKLAPIDELPGISLPAIRLEPGEQLDGDTLRIDLPDSPKLAELARRRKALRERGQGPARLPAQELGSTAAGQLLQRDRGLERNTLLLLAGVALLAVLIALIVTGTLG
jgi:hypothetical protein